MAILTSTGKIRGKVGSVVYKEVNGRTVVSSLPRRKKNWFKPGPQHERFKLATTVSSRVYRELKEFFLNVPPGVLSNKLTSLFTHSHEELTSSDALAGWREIDHREHLWIPKLIRPQRFLSGSPKMEIEGDEVTIKIPPLSILGPTRHRYIPADIGWLENAVTLIHYDFEFETTEVIYKWESERYRVYNDDRQITFLHPSIEHRDGTPIKEGLLVAAFNLRAFVAKNSTAYLNNKDFNPLTILGVWVKG